METTLVKAFQWKAFAKKTWQKQGYSSEDMPFIEPISADHIFESVVQSCKVFNPLIGLRFYVDTDPRMMWPGHELLPTHADGSFEGYHDRLVRELSGKRYCLVVNFLEAGDFELWDWSRRFLYGLYKQIGFNKLGVYNALFIGNYDKTPFGVHQDSESVFHVPLVGKKAMRIWPPDYNLKQPAINRALNYQPFINDSTKIEAQPGGFIYWPADFWHVGEKVDEFSVSLALSLVCRDNLIPPLLDRIKSAAESSPQFRTEYVVPFNPDDLQASAEAIPTDLLSANEFVTQAVSKETIQHEWIRLVTGSNFLKVPAPASLDNIAIAGDTVITGNRTYPIVTVAASSHHLIIGANGHTYDWKEGENIRPLIDQINQGEERTIDSLLEESGTGERQSVKKLLAWLVSVRAINAVVSYTI